MIKALTLTLLLSLTVHFIVATPDNSLLMPPDIHRDLSINDFNPKIQKEIGCLAKNMYYEALSEPEIGQKAVSHVVFNRMESGSFPSKICEVVYQKVNGVCQFSWVCQGAEKKQDQRTAEYRAIEDLAVRLYMWHNQMPDPTKGATYYHADYVNPHWKLKRLVTVGKHIFYS